MKYLMGEESLDDFDEYMATLKSMHIEDLIASKQAAELRWEERQDWLEYVILFPGSIMFIQKITYLN